ncbi:hypothetical protein, partial [Ciceribacter sp. T2.26MG-112.2]|uniref:hypothetical protein n=1 Tax=Ciceribacter sp. T2.26MG-112.2 TaxID=3137154 RepID=UPI0012B6AB12
MTWSLVELEACFEGVIPSIIATADADGLVSGADWVAVPENRTIRRHLVVCQIGVWHGGIDGQQGSGAEQMRQIDIDSLDEATLIELKE